MATTTAENSCRACEKRKLHCHKNCKDYLYWLEDYRNTQAQTKKKKTCITGSFINKG